MSGPDTVNALTMLTTADLARLVHALATTIATARDELCRLDGVIGDADHGIAMAQGFAAAANAVDALSAESTLADQLNAAAKGFLNAVGASSGPLYATAFMYAAKQAGARKDMPLNEAPLLIVAMADGIRMRGKAEPGEKTMLDVWAPVADAARRGMQNGQPLQDIVVMMRESAQQGAAATSAMVATKGRAARLAERSKGHVDPGAASAAIIVGVMADDWHKLAVAE